MWWFFISRIEYKLNDDLEVVHTWLTTNKLTLGQEKAEYMIIGSQQRLDYISVNTNLTIGDEQIL